MADVFDRYGVRFDPSLAGCSRFVRHTDYATLEAQLAEKDAENERLRFAYNSITSAAKIAYERAEKAEALSRTGAVKVEMIDGYLQKSLGWCHNSDYIRALAEGIIALEAHPRDTNTVVSHETGNVEGKPVIRVVFECSENGVIGSTEATVKRVEVEDDGSFTVVIDHWPIPEGQQPVATRPGAALLVDNLVDSRILERLK